ncbi:hypothetical protein [Streptosporangium sp. NPDC002721]|uniref:hypothetical protein n=1 Tax=Streptosporangium sp. NPDC002721 TaxID=3366188 RepID=UPI0036C4EF96
MTDLLEKTDGTGDERVDAALGGLARLAALPVSAHADVFEEVFTGLEQALAAVNGASGPETAAADAPPERMITSGHGVPGPGPALAHTLPGQGPARADGTPDRRP